MKTIINMLKMGIQNDGGYNSAEFKSFARLFKNRMKKQVEALGGSNLEQTTGHYDLFGFFDYNGQTYYYSISDVRDFPKPEMLIRTAKHHKDYTGGMNNYIQLDDNMLKNFLK